MSRDERPREEHLAQTGPGSRHLTSDAETNDPQAPVVAFSAVARGSSSEEARLDLLELALDRFLVRACGFALGGFAARTGAVTGAVAGTVGSAGR